MNRAGREARNALIERLYVEKDLTCRAIGARADIDLCFRQVAAILHHRGVTMRARGGAHLNPLGKNQYTKRKRQARRRPASKAPVE